MVSAVRSLEAVEVDEEGEGEEHGDSSVEEKLESRLNRQVAWVSP